MLIEVGAFILSYIAIEAVGYVFSFVKRKIRENGYENLGFVYKLDQEYQPTEVDVELIGQSKDLLNKYFQEDNRVGVLQSKSIEDRIELIKQLTEDIVAQYDVDVQMVKFSPSSEIGLYCGGYFNSETNEVAINLDMLAQNDPAALKFIVGTIFHECRHAIQHKAITTMGYKYGSEEQRFIWGVNFAGENYISPETDDYGYYYQAVEFDARNFADSIVESF